MTPRDVDAMLSNLDARTTRIEQILPTLATRQDLSDSIRVLATKDDLKRFATRDDLKRFATKDDLKRFATKDDLKRFATKDDLKRFATKEDLKRFATKDDLKGFATKDDLKRFATKEDLKRFATKDDLREGLAATLAESKHYTRVLFEDLKSDIQLLAEHLVHVSEVVERLDRRL